MVHHWQRQRSETFNKIVQLIAKSMPHGLPNIKLLSILEVDFGISKRLAKEYLESLSNLGKIEYDNKNDLWKLYFAEKKGA